MQIKILSVALLCLLIGDSSSLKLHQGEQAKEEGKEEASESGAWGASSITMYNYLQDTNTQISNS